VAKIEMQCVVLSKQYLQVEDIKNHPYLILLLKHDFHFDGVFQHGKVLRSDETSVNK
jgi:hypothetical protein